MLGLLRSDVNAVYYGEIVGDMKMGQARREEKRPVCLERVFDDCCQSPFSD